MKRFDKRVAVMAVMALILPGAVMAGGFHPSMTMDQEMGQGYTPAGYILSMNLDGATEAPAPPAPAAPASPAAPGKPEKGKSQGSKEWGGFGGPLVQYLWLDLSPLDPMTRDRGIDAFDNNIVMVGAMGGVIHKDFRFGGFGFGGSLESADRVAGHRRSADVSLGGGGLFFEYNHNVSSNLGVSLGLMVGAGGMQLKASGPDLGPEGEWSADGSFGLVYPYLGCWYAPTPWLWLELGGGYLYFQMDTDRDRYENDLGVEMVDDDLTGGWQAGIKINFGFNPNR